MGFYHLCYLGVASEAAVGGVGWRGISGPHFRPLPTLFFFFGGGGGEVAVVENTWEKLFFFLGD